MKTPDEIKKGLEVCATLDGDCENCPYDDGKQLTCVDRSRRDAREYIIQLEADNASKQKRIDELEARLAQVERMEKGAHRPDRR